MGVMICLDQGGLGSLVLMNVTVTQVVETPIIVHFQNEGVY